MPLQKKKEANREAPHKDTKPKTDDFYNKTNDPYDALIHDMNRWEFSTSCCSYTCISINVSLRENRTLALTKHDRASPNVIDKQTFLL